MSERSEAASIARRKGFWASWYESMTVFIWTALVVTFAVLVCALVGILRDSDPWFVAAMFTGQIGTVAALGLGLVYDTRRARRRGEQRG